MLDLLTSEDLMRQFRISRKTLDNHIAAGELPAPLFIGRRRYWPAAALEAFVAKKLPTHRQYRSPRHGGRHA